MPRATSHQLGPFASHGRYNCRRVCLLECSIERTLSPRVETATWTVQSGQPSQQQRNNDGPHDPEMAQCRPIPDIDRHIGREERPAHRPNW